MTTTQIRPTSIDGVKRLATGIRRQSGIPHHDALDRAAAAAGYANFTDARRRIGSEPQRHPVFITAYWRDEDGRTGRETLHVEISLPLVDIVTPGELKNARGLAAFRFDAGDHLETTRDGRSQLSAREIICAAARTLAFMQATGLRTGGRVPRAFKSAADGLPGRDHVDYWRDPVTGAAVMTDEPYVPSVVSREVERRAWAEGRGFGIEDVSWAGMYYPGNCRLMLVSEAHPPQMSRWSSALDRLASPSTADAWTGESAAYLPIFVSPGRAASGKAKRGRPKPVASGTRRRGAVSFGRMFVGADWRPDARIPVDDHREIARLLQGLLATAGNRTLYRQIDHVRSTLDEWVQREYSTAELSNDAFHQLYYSSGKSSPLPVSRSQAIDRVRALIEQHYPECRPRTSILRWIEKAAMRL